MNKEWVLFHLMNIFLLSENLTCTDTRCQQQRVTWDKFVTLNLKPKEYVDARRKLGKFFIVKMALEVEW